MVMQGFPPPAHDRWQRGSWQEAPTNRWSFSHLREVVPTARVGRGVAAARVLPTGALIDRDLPVTTSGGLPSSVGAVLDSAFTDGFVALSGGAIVMEEYPGLTGPHTNHLLMSVSKSLIGCVAGILVDRGLIDPNALLTRYVPEFAGAGYDGATVRNVLDMRSGIQFSETYLDPLAEVRILEQVIDWAPRVLTDLPTSMYDYLTTLVAQGPHGGAFDYRSCETDVLGWVCERASGLRMPELLSDLLWSRLGPELDADAAVDGSGAVMHDGGLAVTLRDLARFGQMLADGGRVDGLAVVPAWWLADAHVTNPDSRAAFAVSDAEGWLPGGSYRNQFWIPYPGRPVLLGLGIHGQLVYADAERNFVAAKLSSWPLPQQGSTLLDTLAAVEAIAAHVSY
jgi:CubicO group peptidase (beta-lactamase class C family)